MPQLTEHFAESEFFVPGKCGEVSAYDRSKAFDLAYLILEPLRSQFGIIKITSGKRSAEHNASVGGAKASDHLYLGECAAADIHLPAGSAAMRAAFVHLASIPLDDRRWGQVILYLRANGYAVFIHVSLPSVKHNAFDGTARALVSTYEVIPARGKRVTTPYIGGEPAYPWKG